MLHARDAEWYARLGGAAEPRLRLVCYPHAGGSSALFAAWPLHLDPSIEVLGAQLPGRGARIGHAPIDSLTALIVPLAHRLSKSADRPLALFGHSMGGMLAFEIARLLAASSTPPCHLFVSATPSPDAEWRKPPLHSLSDQELVRSLRMLNGPAVDMLDDHALAELVLPIVRADLRAVERHRVDPGEPLSCPITALVGAEDVEVRIDHVDAWRRFTTGPFAVHVFPGGHFFPMTTMNAVVGTIDDLLASESACGAKSAALD